MQPWINRLMRSPSFYAKRLDRLERRIQRVALYPFGNTERQISVILRAIRSKRQIEEIQQLSQKLAKGLTDEEKQVLAMMADGKKSLEIAQALGVNRQAAYRKMRSATNAAQNVLFLLGYDRKEMQRRFFLVG